MKQKILIFHNPFANKGNNKKGLEKTTSFLGGKGHSYEILATEKELTQNRKNLSEQLSKDFTAIWVVGGDGTLYQLVNSLPQEFWHIPVAVIPAGSGNDFMRNYIAQPKVDNALEVALTGIQQPVDVWQCNGRLFIHGVGIGFDGKVVEDMIKRKTLFSGFAAYYYHVLRQLLNYREEKFKLTQNNKEIAFPCFMITVGNSHTFGGGFKITPKAKITDGLLDVCAISKVPVWLRPRYLKSVEKGKHLHLPYVNYFTTDKLIIKTPETFAGHIDGELFYGKEFTISKHTKDLNLILPQSF